MNISKQIAFSGSLGVASLLMFTGCTKQLHLTQKDFQQYHINSDMQADPAVVSIYEPFKHKMEAEMNRVIGHADKALTKEKTAETLMGNFFCEALLWMSENNAHNPADLAFATKGGIRNDLKAGDITVGHIFEVMPFENTLTILELKGHQIRQLADYIAKTHGQPIAGMTLTITGNKVQEIKIKGQALENEKLYKLVTYDYLANGGDNLTLLTQPVSRTNYPQRMREGLIEYVSELTKEGKKVNAELDGRIKNQLTEDHLSKQVGGFSAAVAMGSLPFQVNAKSKKVKLTILHTNDVHSRIEPFPMDGGKYQGLGGVARRSTLINKIRKEEEHLLLLDAGDMFQGTPYFNLFGGKLELDLMTKLGYDAGTFGNHEFDNGLDGLVKYLDHAKFPFLTANYDFKGTVLEGKTQDYTIFHKGGIKIGVFGLGVDIEGLVDPNNFKGMKYLDPIDVSNKVVSILKEKHKCDLVICLSHLGYQYENDKVSDLILAAKTSGIDLIIGGHTHTFLNEPTLVTNLKGTTTVVNQVGFAGINLGRIDFIMEPGSEKKQMVARNYQVNPTIPASRLA